MLGTVFLLLAIVVVVGAVFMRRRVDRAIGGEVPVTDDPVLEDILRRGGGTGEPDEPLDEDRIREEEDRFWDDDWEEPDPWGG